MRRQGVKKIVIGHDGRADTYTTEDQSGLMVDVEGDWLIIHGSTFRNGHKVDAEVVLIPSRRVDRILLS